MRARIFWYVSDASDIFSKVIKLQFTDSIFFWRMELKCMYEIEKKQRVHKSTKKSSNQPHCYWLFSFRMEALHRLIARENTSKYAFCFWGWLKETQNCHSSLHCVWIKKYSAYKNFKKKVWNFEDSVNMQWTKKKCWWFNEAALSLM